MQKGHKAEIEREKEKNNESSERQECFSGNVFQENEEGNIMLRKKGLFGSLNGFENVIITEEIVQALATHLNQSR